MWIEIVLFLFLAVCAVYDGFSRRVPLAVVWIGMLTAVCLQIGGAMGETNIVSAALSLLPGAGFFLLSFLTREKVVWRWMDTFDDWSVCGGLPLFLDFACGADGGICGGGCTAGDWKNKT